ncbi:MAG: CoA transferase [Chloroflexi bacterium]|nr:MAG: CoA transferase [Chloroflexota bacterium]
MERPLTGVRVIALEQYMSAPYCTMLLADSGAEVIKIERPGRGDPRRSIPPYAADEQGRRVAGGFISYNRNKKSVALNLRAEAGRRIYERLVKASDVVVENLRPGAADKMGLGYEQLKALNPRLVYAAISGFGRLEGHIGPYAHRPAFDIVAEAMGGIMNLVGFADKPPSWTIYGMADVYTGLVTAYGVMLALFMRERTGQGQFVDSAMLDNMLAFNERMTTLYSFTGESPERGRLKHLYPRGAFRCQDGYLALNIPDDLQWKRLCEAMGRADLKDDPRTVDGTARAANADFVRPIIEDWLAVKTRAQAVALLGEQGVPSGPVYTAEDIFDDPHIAARNMLVTVDDPVAGPRKYARSPLHLSSAPEIPTAPAPRLGEHTCLILRGVLGYDESEIEQLRDQGVIEIADCANSWEKDSNSRYGGKVRS